MFAYKLIVLCNIFVVEVGYTQVKQYIENITKGFTLSMKEDTKLTNAGTKTITVTYTEGGNNWMAVFDINSHNLIRKQSLV